MTVQYLLHLILLLLHKTKYIHGNKFGFLYSDFNGNNNCFLKLEYANMWVGVCACACVWECVLFMLVCVAFTVLISLPGCIAFSLSNILHKCLELLPRFDAKRPRLVLRHKLHCFIWITIRSVSCCPAPWAPDLLPTCLVRLYVCLSACQPGWPKTWKQLWCNLICATQLQMRVYVIVSACVQVQLCVAGS